MLSDCKMEGNNRGKVGDNVTPAGFANWTAYRQNLLQQRADFDRKNRAILNERMEDNDGSRSRRQKLQARLGANDSQFEGYTRQVTRLDKPTPFQAFWASKVNELGYVDGSNLANKLNDEFDDSNEANEFFRENANDNSKAKISFRVRRYDAKYDDSEVAEKNAARHDLLIIEEAEREKRRHRFNANMNESNDD